MAQADDIIRAGCLGFVDGLLHIGVESLAVAAAGDAVEVVAVFILEIGRGGLGDGFGGGHAHDSQLLASGNVEDLVAVQHIVASDTCRFIVEVAGQVGVRRPVNEVHGAGHIVVELVIAQRSRIVTCGAHELDDGLALVHAAVGSALGMVAGIHQQDTFMLGSHLLLQSRHRVKAHGVLGFVDVGMGIVGEENHRVLGFFGLCGKYRRRKGQHQCQSQKSRDQFTHRNFLLCLAVYSNTSLFYTIRVKFESPQGVKKKQNFLSILPEK